MGDTATTSAALLLLADGRFPSGAHAQSHGLEAAVVAGLVHDLDGLTAWIAGCLSTTWTVDAAVTVLAHRLAWTGAGLPSWEHLDAEAAARLTSPVARRVSRTLGRQLLRTGQAVWPSASTTVVGSVHEDGPLQPLAMGTVAAAAGLGASDAALIGLHHATQGAATAAVRLLGLDPYAVTAHCADLTHEIHRVVEEANGTGDDPSGLPAPGAPMLDLLLAAHDAADIRMFAS